MTVDPRHLDEWLSAYLDGELTETEAQTVERALREDDSARRRLTEFRRTVSLVAGLPRHAAPPTLAEELLGRLERSELLGDVGDPRSLRAPRRWRLPMWTSLAAAFLLSVLGGWWMFLSPRVQPAPQPISPPVTAFAEKEGTRSNDVERVGALKTDPSRAAGSRVATSEPHADRLALADKKLEADANIARRETGAASRVARRSELSEATISEGEIVIRSKDEATVSGADLAAKLTSGFDAAKIRTHPYRNESVRLRVQVRNADAMERVADALRTGLIEAGVADLDGDAGPAAQAGASAPSRFFHRGRAGENFHEQDSRQIIARLRPEDVDTLLSAASALDVRDADVHLAAGTLSFKGLRNVRSAMASVASASSAPGAVSNTAEDFASRLPEVTQPAPASGDGSSTAAPSGGAGRMRTPDQWTALLETLGRTFVSPSNADPGSAKNGTSPAPECSSSVAGGTQPSESTTPGPSTVSSVETAFGDAVEAPNGPGLAARRIEAARAGAAPVVANRPATIESMSQPTHSTTGIDRPDPPRIEARDEPLVTLVIEVTVAPDGVPTAAPPAPSPVRPNPPPAHPAPSPPTSK